MKCSIAGASGALNARGLLSISLVSLFAFGAGCERSTDQEMNAGAPGPVIQAEALGAAPPARAAAPAAKGAQGAAEPACGEPKEDCGCDGKGAADAVDEAAPVEDVRAGSSPSRGPADAPVTIIVFSDFECPFCYKAEQTIADLEAEYSGNVRVVFKNNPLPFHKRAKLAAKAALAANEQGKFWEYKSALFEHQDALDQASLERYAGDLGLDLARFRRAMASEALDAAVEADIAEAKRLAVQGTPTFFVNGQRIRGARSVKAFQPVMDRALTAL